MGAFFVGYARLSDKGDVTFEFLLLQRCGRCSLYPVDVDFVLPVIFSAVDVSVPPLSEISRFKNQVPIAVKNLEMVKVGVNIVALRTPHFVKAITIGCEAVWDVEQELFLNVNILNGSVHAPEFVGGNQHDGKCTNRI